MMTKQYFILTWMLLITISVYTQSNCSRFYPMKEGAHFTHTVYDESNVPMGKVTYKVLNVASNSGTYSTTMEVGGRSMTSEYDITCTRDGVSIDYSSLGGGMLARYGAAGDNVEITGTSIYLPNNIVVGDTLPPAKMEMKLTINIGGASNPTNTIIEMIDRKVIAQEDITTPAGTFEDCYVLSYTMRINGQNVTGLTHKIWMAPDVGVVQTKDISGVDPNTGADIYQGKAILTDYSL